MKILNITKRIVIKILFKLYNQGKIRTHKDVLSKKFRGGYFILTFQKGHFIKLISNILTRQFTVKIEYLFPNVF